MGVKDQTLAQFLEALAAPTPTPGGGSASALAGALSVALSRMVAGLARDKRGYEDVQAELVAIEEGARRIQDRLEGLIEEDALAYEAVIAAMRMSRSTDEERAARVRAMQAAYTRATEVPLETMERCVEALEVAEAAAKKGNRSATTDVGVAALLAEAAIRGASLNCRVNLAAIRDEGFRSRTEGRLEELLGRADAIGHEVMAVVGSRL